MNQIFTQTNNILSSAVHSGFIDYHNDFEHPETGVSFHLWEDYYTPKHYHNHFEFFIITAGKARHITNSEEHILCKNTLCFIKPECSHQLLGMEGAPYSHMNIAVTPEKLKNMCEILAPDMQKIVDETDYFYIVLSDSECKYFLDHAEQINMCKNNYKDDASVQLLFINEMLLHALSIMYRSKQKAYIDHPDWFSELLSKLCSSEYFSYSLADIYKLTNYSPPVLLKYFKQYTGETMISFLTKRKMNYACSLLETTNCTTLDIADKLNYSSLSHFNKMFKKYIGCTPREYRKNFKKMQ